jgi:5-methylcytosine-specific restriction endonuclease McrA
MTYRANVDAVWLINDDGVVIVWEADELDLFAVPACRCYRCGDLLVFENVTVDRIVPGCMGGTYRRNNIRPACAGCNSETGGKLSRKPKRRRR